jgi:chromosome segregation ATPase
MIPTGKRPERARRINIEAGRKSAEWQDTAVELIKSLMDNLASSRSIEVKRRCMQSIENETTKLAYDSAILHRERMRFDEAAEASLEELHRLDAEGRALRHQLGRAEERAAAAERRLKELQARLLEAERQVGRLQPEEGCRDRLVEALRQLDEEAKARLHAEQQARRGGGRGQSGRKCSSTVRAGVAHHCERRCPSGFESQRSRGVGAPLCSDAKSRGWPRPLSPVFGGSTK